MTWMMSHGISIWRPSRPWVPFLFDIALVSQHALKSWLDDQRARDYSSLRNGKAIMLTPIAIAYTAMPSFDSETTHGEIDWNWGFYGDFLNEFETWVFQMPLVQYWKCPVCMFPTRNTSQMPLLWCGLIKTRSLQWRLSMGFTGWRF